MTALVAALGDVAEIVQGGRLKKSARDFVENGFPAWGAGGQNGFLPQYEFNRSAIVLSSIGARCGKCFLAEGKWSSLANTQLIFPKNGKVDLRFLWYQLDNENGWIRRGAGQPFIRPSDVKQRQIFFPPLDEQRRIAAILDKAEAIRRNRRQAFAETKTLLRSAYVHMVGYKNPDHSSWPLCRIEELAAPERGSMRTGPFGSDLLHSEFVDEGVAVLGIDNAVQNRFAWAERRFITPEKYEKLRRYRVFPGDVIVTIMGTTGRSAVVPDDIPEAITTKHLATITPNRSRAHPVFLSFAIHSDPLIIRQIMKANKGAIMAGLNLGIIKDLEIRRPPIDQQQRFADYAAVAYHQASHLDDNKVNGEDLFGSLSQRAFRGEL